MQKAKRERGRKNEDVLLVAAAPRKGYGRIGLYRPVAWNQREVERVRQNRRCFAISAYTCEADRKRGGESFEVANADTRGTQHTCRHMFGKKQLDLKAREYQPAHKARDEQQRQHCGEYQK